MQTSFYGKEAAMMYISSQSTEHRKEVRYENIWALQKSFTEDSVKNGYSNLLQTEKYSAYICGVSGLLKIGCK
jgi:hypothetical protein